MSSLTYANSDIVFPNGGDEYRLDPDAVVIVDVLAKKTQATPATILVRRISSAGTFRLHNGQQFLTQALTALAVDPRLESSYPDIDWSPMARMPIRRGGAQSAWMTWRATNFVVA